MRACTQNNALLFVAQAEGDTLLQNLQSKKTRNGIVRMIPYQELQATFRAQARQLHPDMHAGEEIVFKERMQNLNQAWEIVRNEDKRQT